VDTVNRWQAFKLAQNRRLRRRGKVDENRRADLSGAGIIRKLDRIARDHAVSFKPVKPRLNGGARKAEPGSQLGHRRAGIRAQKREKAAVCLVKFDHNDEISGNMTARIDKSCKVPSLFDGKRL
jgi:hypothetical protein